MARDARQQRLLLGGLVGVLLLVSWWQFGGSSTPSATTASARRPAAAKAAPGTPAATASNDEVLARGVGLGRLGEDRPAPEEGGRDPFRSGPASETGQSSANQAPPPQPLTPSVTAPPQPPPPPMIPPIAVKFIGVVSRQDVGKVAVLSDGKNVYYGRAGEIVDGRWRIVSIGEESLQIEYADGRGRQTVRLTG